MNYNLLDQKWIPVLYRDGRWERVGIRKVLEDAARIRQIAASNPMDRVAIIRFLLAVLYWCKGNPPAEADPMSDGAFPREWFSKLDENRDCFNLLGEGKRFYQDCQSRRSRAVTDLIQEIPAGNNFWHFRHSTDKRDGLCPVCCVMGLLRLPLFSVSGLSGPGEPNLMAGINGVPPIYVVPQGKSLMETLLVNWSSCSTLGNPSWVSPDNSPTPDKMVHLLTGLTLLSRRVWLHDPIEQAGTCIGCGSHETALIKTIEFQSAGKQENEQWNDPHVVYTEQVPRRALRAEDLAKTGKFRMDRPWPRLLARIAETGKQASLLIVGFATNKAKNVDVWERIIDMPSAGSIQESLELWSKQGGSLEASAMRVLRSKVVGRAVIATIRPHVENAVSAKLGQLLTGGDEAWDRAAGEYRPMMEMIARSLSPGFTVAAVRRRRHIAGALPNMRTGQSSPKNPGRRKEGGK